MYADIDASSQRARSAEQFAGAYAKALRTATATEPAARGPAPLTSPATSERCPYASTRACSARSRSTSRLKVVTGGGEGTRVRGRARCLSRAAPGRARSAAAPALPAARRCSRATAPCSPKALKPARRHADDVAGAQSTARRIGRRRHRELGPIPSLAPGRTGSRRSARGRGRRRQRPRARARRPPARHPRRRAARGRRPAVAACSLRAPAGAAVRTTVSPAMQRAAVSALGGQLGGIVAHAALHRPDPGGRGDRPRRPAAAGLDVQDGHAHGRAAARTSPTRTRSSPTPPTPRSTASS